MFHKIVSEMDWLDYTVCQIPKLQAGSFQSFNVTAEEREYDLIYPV